MNYHLAEIQFDTNFTLRVFFIMQSENVGPLNMAEGCNFANSKSEIKENMSSIHQCNHTHWMTQSDEISSNSSRLLKMDILNDANVSKSGKLECRLKLLVMTMYITI